MDLETTFHPTDQEMKSLAADANSPTEAKGTEARDHDVSFQEFADGTTFHGLRYVTNNSYSGCRRLVWLVVVLAMTTWLIFSIIAATLTLLSYPQSSSFLLNYAPNITFPAVTICNINMYRSDALDPASLELLAKIFSPSGAPDPSLNLTNRRLFHVATQDELIEAIAGTTHQIENMLLSCKWRNKPCSHLNFTRRFTDQGFCFTFNDPAEGQEVLTVSTPGVNNGLHMRLNIEHDLYSHGESTAAGIKVLLHPQGELPIVKEYAFSLAPGFEASVAVRQQVIKSLKAPYKSNCTDGALKVLPFKYSVPACQFECMVRYVVDKCECRDPRWAVPAPMCNLEKQVYCIYHYQEEFRAQEFRCSCPIACETTSYDQKTSLAYWPSTTIISDINARTNKSKEFIRENYLEVYIFYEEILYMSIEQTMAYTMANFQSDIGGYMGLLCGMSLITLVEWLDFVVLALNRRLRRFLT